MLLVLLSADAMAATPPSVSLHAAASGVTLGESLVQSGTVTHPRASATSVAILRRAGARRRIATAELTAQRVSSGEVTLAKKDTYDLVAQYVTGTLKARSEVVAISVEAAARDRAAGFCGGWGDLGLSEAGTLWAWGDNSAGQLGLGDTDDREAPTQVGSDTDWVAVSGGQYSAVALRRNGTLWAWGDNGNGQLGLGDTDQRDTPAEVGMGSR